MPTRPKTYCPDLWDGDHIVAIFGSAARALRRDGRSEEVAEMRRRVRETNDFSEQINIVQEYVTSECGGCGRCRACKEKNLD